MTNFEFLDECYNAKSSIFGLSIVEDFAILVCVVLTNTHRVANRPEFFGTVPNSDAVSRVQNGSFRDRLMSPIFTEQKSNVNNDPYFRFSPLIFAFEFT